MTRKPCGSNPRNLTPEQIEYKRKKAKEDYWENAEEKRKEKREEYARNRDEILKRNSEYHKKNYIPKARKRKTEEELRESRRKRNREYRKKNREKIHETHKRYMEKNKNKLESPEYKEQYKKYKHDYYTGHKENWDMTREDMDHANELQRKRYEESEEHRTKRKQAAKSWEKGNPEKIKANRLKSYGITLAEFYGLLEFQGWKCAICGYSDMSNPKIFPFVDHCHTNNHVRGILCAHCNHGLGQLKDSPYLLKKAAKYLEKYALFGPIGKGEGEKQCTPK
jgi:hypothetical protein